MSKRRPLTEYEWLHTASAADRLSYLQQHCRATKHPGGSRRFRLLCCAFAQPVRRLLTDPRSIRALDAAEFLADGNVKRAEAAQAFQDALLVGEEIARRQNELINSASRRIDDGMMALARARALADVAAWSLATVGLVRAVQIVQMCAAQVQLPAPVPTWTQQHVDAMTAIERAHGSLIQDIFGNPFHPVSLDPTWLTANVRDLARTTYDERAFERMPILADALMDAGCNDESILSHCRNGELHVRGCWVVDLLLERK